MSYQFEQQMLAYLVTGSSSLIALQGNRVYPMPLPERATLPATTYLIILGNNHIKTHGGPSGSVLYHVQFDVWGNSHLQARRTADALIATIDNWTGTSTMIDDEADRYEPETALHRVMIESYILIP